MSPFAESVFEQAAPTWLEATGWQVRYGAENRVRRVRRRAQVPGEPLARLNPARLPEVLDKAVRKLTRPGGEVLVHEAADGSAGVDVRRAASLDMAGVMSNIAHYVE